MDRAGRAARARGAMRRSWFRLGSGLPMGGVLAATARAQVGFDRAGGDYTSFPLRAGDPAQCAVRCERDPRCRAWAFSYPATESPTAVCWLKSRVTPRFEAPCCASGVRGTGVIEPKSGTTESGVDRNGGACRDFGVVAQAKAKRPETGAASGHTQRC